MAALPIVFIHAGEQHWLRQSLAQARSSNPEARVILLSHTAQNMPKGVEFYYLGDFFGEAAALKQSYEHFSQYDPAYELFCFQRWFALRDFMRREKLPRAVYLDSDVLAFADLDREGEVFADCDMTLSQGHCGHNSYVNNLEVLSRFCEYCAKFLSQEKAAQIGGVLRDVTLQSLGLRETLFPLNDMRLLQLFRENADFLIGDTAIVHQGVTFDHDIGASQGGYEMSAGEKKLSWQDERPYCRHLRLGKSVRFAALHFKGGKKPRLVQTFEEHGRNYSLSPGK